MIPIAISLKKCYNKENFFSCKEDNMANTVFDVKGINLPKTKLGQTKMEKLLASSEELFAKNGFYGTSISDICKHAGTAVGTFYIYFETKTDVYKYLMERYKNDITELLHHNISLNNVKYNIQNYNQMNLSERYLINLLYNHIIVYIIHSKLQ